jgi:5-methyltetrahydrofolate--homocysteine methyltransferase
MRNANPQVVLIAKPNAGIPRWVGSDLVYDGTPEIMANYARHMAGVGARLIGACCGSTPTHIRAMAEALKNPSSTLIAPEPVATQNGSPKIAKKSKRERRHNRRRGNG